MKHKDEIEQVKKMLFENPSKSFQIMQENIPKYTMYGYMAKSNEDNGNNIALSFGKRKITYDEFLSMIDDYAKGFLSLGIKKGDRVALLLPNLPESTIIIYALNKIGAISDNIDPTTSCERIKYFLVTEGVSAIVCFDKIYEKLIKPIEPFIYEELKIDKILVPKVSDSLSLPEKIIYNFANRKNNIISSSYGKIDIINIPEFIENSKYQICYTNKYYPNEIATICHSSGTEGMPKTIPSTNENVNFISFQHEVSGIDYSKVKTFLHILPGFA